MREFLLKGACAVGILALCMQQAQAWKNIKFGAGVNFECQSGGNSLGWGLFRSAQPPGPDHGFGGGHFGARAPYNGAAYGGYFPGGPVGGGHFDAPAPVPAPVPVPAPGPVAPMPHGHAYHYGQPATQGNVVYYNAPGYQPGYQTVNYPYYPISSYYPASYYYGR